MLPPSSAEGTTAQLVRDLEVRPLGSTTFVGAVPARNLPRMFGGQVLAQGLLAAAASPPERHPHSLHCYFLAPGDPAVPVTYTVRRLRDGGAFSVRAIEARQNTILLASLQASFHVRETFLEHMETPEGEVPNELLRTTLPDLPRSLRSLGEEMPAWWTDGVPFDFRFATPPTALTGGAPSAASQQFWLRSLAYIPPAPAMQAAVLAWVSDLNLLDAALRPHGASWYGTNRVVGSSLDHVIWFHDQANANQWTWCRQSNELAHGGRAHCAAQYRSATGSLLASASQEGVIRPAQRPT